MSRLARFCSFIDPSLLLNGAVCLLALCYEEGRKGGEALLIGTDFHVVLGMQTSRYFPHGLYIYIVQTAMSYPAMVLWKGWDGIE